MTARLVLNHKRLFKLKINWMVKQRTRCRAKVLQHMEVHVKNAIQHEDFFITKCKQACRSGSSGHFHCPFCLKTTIKRQDTLRHLQICKPPLHDAQLDADADYRERVITSQTEECKAGSVNLPHLSTDKLPVSAHDSEMQGQRDPAETARHPPPEFLSLFSPNLDNPPCRVRRAKLPTVLCPHCNVQFQRKNIKKHFYRKHSDKAVRDITATSHLDAVCIDEKNGIYAVKKSFLGPLVPLHVQKKTWGKEHQIKCESSECQQASDFAARSGLKTFQCHHVRSLDYCSAKATDTVLSTETINNMVQK
ncbi:hypothetical protein UPYG_G00095870 [Umbra pygmaea]|uniref:C2H2-type domain-containing protein n=1 Tax=Umbra pygmaea TaxID=75934 RepID=A0ABD0XKB3_UMBPY